jgi:thermitase
MKSSKVLKTSWTLVLASLLLLGLAGSLGHLDSPASQQQDDQQVELLVKFIPEAIPSDIAQLHQQLDGHLVNTLPQLSIEVVEVPAGSAAGALASYNSHPLVQYAELNPAVQVLDFPQDDPNDPQFYMQWGNTRIGAPAAWAISTSSSSIRIAIVDSGIDQDHPDLSAKIIASHNFSDSPTVDDISGHGTHVAGIAAAITNNATGIAGVGCNASLLNAKVLGDDGVGTGFSIAQGILWATNGPDGDPDTDDGAHAINLSLGTLVPSPTVEEAVNYAWDHGLVVVAAAGNHGSTIPGYPARYPNVIAVAGSRTYPGDPLVPSSAHGDWVDVAAPGESIWSAFNNGGYGNGAGTSMASPFVAGLAALLYTSPNISDLNGNGFINDEIKYAIESSCKDTGVDVKYGRINAYDAVTAAIPSLGFISGTVVDDLTDEPVYPTYGCSIKAGTREAFTYPDGTYTIYGVPEGEYELTLSALGWNDASQSITVTAGGTTTASFRLTVSPPGSITGFVRDIYYSPIEGATITDGTRQATSAADGSYTLTDVPAGNYTATASAPGYMPTSSGIVVLSGTTATQNFILPASNSSPPNQPVNQAPANGATGEELCATLESSDFSDPNGGDTHAASQWQATATSGDYSSPAFDSDTDSLNLLQITIPPDTLDYGTTYYWRVRHEDNNGKWSDWSAETSFTTQSDSAAPSVWLDDIADSVASLASVSGTASAGSNPLDRVEVRVNNTTDSTYWDGTSWVSAETWLDAVGTTSWTFTMPALTEEKAYTVSARSVDSAAVHSTVASDSFTVASANNAPNTPSSPSPADEATGITIDEDLGWTGGEPDAGDTVTYDVYFGTDPDSLALVSDDQAATTYDPGTLDYSTQYYWKVVATDNHAATAEGPIWSFTTGAEPNSAPNTPTSPSPADEATGIAIDADLGWTGGDPDAGDTVTYDVYFGTSETPPLASDNQTVTTYDPGTLTLNTTYYWRIVATDSQGAVTEGPLWRFATEAGTPVTADFWATPVSGVEPLRVNFTDGSTSQDGIASWLWDFGDGDTSTEQNPSHVYAQDGTYTVSLTVTEADGDTNTKNKTGYITVSDTSPAADFSASPLSGGEPLTVDFTDSSTSYDGITSWLWDFGDGNTSTDQSPRHTYTEATVFTVTLTVSEMDGSSSAVSRPVEVGATGTTVTVTQAGTALAGYRVYACTAEGDYAGYSQLIDASGQASFTMADGSYKFRVYYDGTCWWSPLIPAPGYADIDIPAATRVAVAAAGAPLEDCWVYAYTDDGVYAGCGRRTDASGQASFTLPNGSYKFKVYCEGTYWWSDAIAATGSASIDIPAATRVTVATAEGPLEGYWVYAYTDDGAYARCSRRTDASGQASFSLPDGSYKFKLYYGGRFWWTDAINATESASIDIPAATRVTVARAGEPVEGYWAYAYTSEGDYAGCAGRTDATGQATFTLPDGDYKFRVYCGGTYWWSNAVAATGSASIDIPAPTLVTVATASEPVEGYWVYAYTADGTYAGFSRRTDASGQASFTLLDGDYKFKVYYSGSYWWSDVIAATETAGIYLPSPTLVAITKAGEPLEGCWVYAYTVDGAYAGCARRTDSSGEATFSLSDGSYKFRAYHEGTYWWSQVIASPGSASLDIA